MAFAVLFAQAEEDSESVGRGLTAGFARAAATIPPPAHAPQRSAVAASENPANPAYRTSSHIADSLTANSVRRTVDARN